MSNVTLFAPSAEIVKKKIGSVSLEDLEISISGYNLSEVLKMEELWDSRYSGGYGNWNFNFNGLYDEEGNEYSVRMENPLQFLKNEKRYCAKEGFEVCLDDFIDLLKTSYDLMLDEVEARKEKLS